MKTPSKPTHAPGLFTAVLVIALLVLAPFIGGRDSVIETALLASVALIALGTMILSHRFSNPIGVWPFAVFVGLIAASSIVTVSLHATIEQTLYFAACAAAAIAASSSLRSDKRFVTALLALTGVGLVLGAMAVVEYWESGNGWRVFGPFYNPGYFGGYLVMIVPVALAVFLSSRSAAVAAGGGLAFGFSFAALLLTGTRFALVFSLVSIILFFILAILCRAIRKKQLIHIAVAVLIALVAVSLCRTTVESRVEGKAAAQQSHSFPFRVATWKGTANIVRKHPVLGTGAGTFELVFQQYMVAGYTRVAHNSYLELASDAGVPALAAGAAAFGILFFAGLKNLRREDDEGDKSQFLLPHGAVLMACALAAALVGALARNLFDSDIYNPGIGFTFWTLAGVLAARAPVKTEAKPSVAARAGTAALIGVMIVMWSLFAMARHSADAAMESIKSGDLAAGIDYLRSAAVYDPLCGEYRMQLGQTLVYASGNDEAQWKEEVSSLNKAISLEPTRARNMIALGRILRAKGDDNGAIRMFGKALIADPHATPAMVAMAEIWKQSKETLSEAELMYERLIDQEKSPVEELRGVPEIVNPDYVWAHFYFGTKYLSDKDWNDAEEQFSAVIERLELRESYTVQRQAAEASGMVDSAEESALNSVLQRSKDGLAKAKENEVRADDAR
ncbi:MAG: O-antigen ligase family protein [Armatimonadota bacterium]